MTEQMTYDEVARKRTPEEIAERVFALRRICKQLDKDNEESPLPDDFIDYCKGRKWIGAVPK